MDNTYCIIRNIYNKKIELCIYDIIENNININTIYLKYPICCTASNTRQLFHLLNLIEKVAFLSPQHILYIGKELYKAEISVLIHQKYIQE